MRGTILALLSNLRFDENGAPSHVDLRQRADATDIVTERGSTLPEADDGLSKIGYRCEAEFEFDDCTYEALAYLVVKKCGMTKEVLCSQSARSNSPDSMIAVETAVIKVLFPLIGYLRRSTQPDVPGEFRVVVRFLDEVPVEWREPITEQIIGSLNAICDHVRENVITESTLDLIVSCRRYDPAGKGCRELYTELESRLSSRERRVIVKRAFLGSAGLVGFLLLEIRNASGNSPIAR